MASQNNNSFNSKMRTFNLHLEYGECAPMPDKQFYDLMTTDEKGITDLELVKIVLKYYPALSMFEKRKDSVCISSPVSINELLAQYALPEVEFS